MMNKLGKPVWSEPVDSTPVEVPIGFRGESVDARMKRMLYQLMRAEQEKNEVESEDEAEDLELGDDEDPLTIAERCAMLADELAEEKKRLAVTERRIRERRVARDGEKAAQAKAGIGRAKGAGEKVQRVEESGSEGVADDRGGDEEDGGLDA